MDTPNAATSFDAATLEGLVISYGLKIVGVIALLAVAWILSSWFRRATTRGLERARLELTVARFFGNAARWMVLLLAVLGCLEIFGFRTTSFAAVLGAASLAVGLAFQGSLSNLAAGLMLLMFRPFRVGDVVSVAGQLGKVYEIELFTTSLDTPDNRRIILPNSSVFGSTIENITHHPSRRVDVNVGVAYAADLDRTREVLERAAEGVPGRIAEEPAKVLLLELGASSVNWQVRVWAPTDKFFDVKQAATRAVKVALDEAGLSIPFPQMDVHLHGAMIPGLAPNPQGAGARAVAS